MTTKRARYSTRPRRAARWSVLVTALMLAACSDQPDVPLAPGQAEFNTFCSACHGPDGAGRAPSFPPLAGSELVARGPEHVALIALAGLRGPIEVAGQSYNGFMPAVRQASDAELAALIGFIGDQWADWPTAIDAARIAELRAATAGVEMPVGRDGLDALAAEVLK